MMLESAKRTVRDYFDEDAAGYLDAYGQRDSARGEIFRERRACVLQLLRTPVGRALDIGSGPGVFTPALLELDQDAECWVVDLSPKMIEAARACLAGPVQTGRVHFDVADIEHLPYAQGAFDTVLCVGVLQYLRAAGPALEELARVTRPGGQIILTFPNSRSPLNLLHRAAIAAARGGRSVARLTGLRPAPDRLRLTFRQDIPNGWFALRHMVAAARRAGLHADPPVYHSLHFPFAIPGMQAGLRFWDRTANRAIQAGRCRTWGREVILRLVRQP